MKWLKKVFIVFIVLVGMFLVVNAFLKKPNLMPVKAQMNKLDLSNVDKLMIVVHPADESVFGGAHLLDDNYLVVCVSCGYNKKTTDSFLKAIKYSGDVSVMMGYFDMVYFNGDIKKIKKDLKYILNYKNWTDIVTHNPDGEYGNFQHKQLNKILENESLDNLYYFGEYYSSLEMDRLDLETTLDGDLIKDKINMVKMYDDIYEEYQHIIPFENWIGALEWEN